ncbi:hypothetical protein D3248_00795 [Leucobacter zeae]|nr:hypothetical protein [Leucobacter zeae]
MRRGRGIGFDRGMTKLMTALLIVPALLSAQPGPAWAADSGAASIASAFRISPPTATPAQCALWKRVDMPRYRKYCL